MEASNQNSSATASTSNWMSTDSSSSFSSSSSSSSLSLSDYDGASVGVDDENKDYDNSPPAPPPSNSDSNSSNSSAPPPYDNSPPSPPSNTGPPENTPPPENNPSSPNTPSTPSGDGSSPKSSPSGSGSGSSPSTPKQQSSPSPPPPPKSSNKQQSPPSPSGSSQESSSQSTPQKSPPPPPPSPNSSGRPDSSENSPSRPQSSPETSKSPPRSSNSSSSTPPSPFVSSPSANNASPSPGLSPKAIAPTARSSPKSSFNDNSSGGSNASGGGGSSNSGGSSNNNNNNNNKPTGIIEVAIGVAVATVFIFVMLAFFYFKKKKARRQPMSPSPNYMPAPANFGVTSDAYMGHSTDAAAYYTSQLHDQQSNYMGSFGSAQGGQNYQGHDSGIIAGSKTFFSYEDLMEMTNAFASQNIIGEGGFGCVYKGCTRDGRLVAVKQLKAGSGQGDREFRAEVEIISRVHHRHLVSLVGYSVAGNQKLLIYEFVPNNTLEHHLHAKDLPVLEWVKRVKIAVGAAKGLAYLHEDCHPKIIHRDIKSANILLDNDFEAQVADFGLARLNDTAETHVSTRVMGTFGYLAPEYASSGKLTDRSDVYSFGVVLLELITGRKPVDPTRPLGDESLVEWARPLLIQALETGDFGELIDARLEKRYVQSQMFRMIEAAAACVRHSAAKRPRMALVVRALDFEGDSDDLSNGVKVGQSTAYDSGQYNEEILKFRRMALASDMSSEFEMYSGEYKSREITSGQQNSWNYQYSSGDYTSGELETKAFNPNGGEYSGASGYYVDSDGGGRFK